MITNHLSRPTVISRDLAHSLAISCELAGAARPQHGCTAQGGRGPRRPLEREQVTFSHLLPPSLAAFSHLLAPSRTFSDPPFTSSHLLSPPLASSHLHSPPLTSSHLRSPPLTSSRRPLEREQQRARRQPPRHGAERRRGAPLWAARQRPVVRSEHAARARGVRAGRPRSHLRGQGAHRQGPRHLGGFLQIPSDPLHIGSPPTRRCASPRPTASPRSSRCLAPLRAPRR